METALDVLSRAATMVQDGAGDLRLMTKKELPTAKWRRERRQRAEMYHHTAAETPANLSSAELHLHHQSIPHLNEPIVDGSASKLVSPLALTPLPSHSPQHLMMAATSTTLYPNHHPYHPQALLTEANKLTRFDYDEDSESPLDMTISSVAKQEQALDVSLKKQSSVSPTPKTSIARPSVITQAPSKRELHHTINQEPLHAHNRNIESLSMCENVIDEHFRRSLGPDYVALINKRVPVSSGITTKPLSALTDIKAPPIMEHIEQTQPESLVVPKHLLSPLASTNSDSINRKTEQLPIILEKTSILAATDTQYTSTQEEPLPLHRFDSKILYAPIKNNSSPPITATSATVDFVVKEPFRCLPSSQNTPPITGKQIVPPPTHYSPPSYASSTASNSTASNNAILSPIMRIKTETNLNHFNISATNTPPASPNSLSNVSHSTNSSDVLASVDDHFAKALGDAWKKLKENDNAQKKTTLYKS